mgnify:CR=1 FL=1
MFEQQNHSKGTKVLQNSENLSYGNSFFKGRQKVEGHLWIFSEFLQDKLKELTTIINLY